MKKKNSKKSNECGSGCYFSEVLYNDDHKIIHGKRFDGHFTYDQSGREIHRDIIIGSKNSSIDNTYDDQGRLIRVKTSFCETLYEYSENGKAMVSYDKDNRKLYEGTYDKNMRITSFKSYSKDDTIEIIEHQYLDDEDTTTHITNVYKNDGINNVFMRASHSIVKRDNNIEMLYTITDSEGVSRNVITSEVDRYNRVVKQISYSNDDTVQSEKIYKYRKNGKLLSAEQQDIGYCITKTIFNSKERPNFIYIYDDKESKTPSNIEFFKYDNNGNAIFESSKNRKIICIYDKHNKLLLQDIMYEGNHDYFYYEYDKFGNMSYVLNNIVETRSVFDPSTNKELIISIDGDFTKLCEFKASIIMMKYKRNYEEEMNYAKEKESN